MNGTLREKYLRELSDQFRIHDERRHCAVAQLMLLHARGVDDFGIKIDPYASEEAHG
jgi:hypothetical protein